jgi:hypothetical protein
LIRPFYYTIQANFPDGASAPHVVVLSALWLPKWHSLALQDSGIKRLDSLKFRVFFYVVFFVFYARFRRNLI